jgi:CheY-like chemotaxis protein
MATVGLNDIGGISGRMAVRKTKKIILIVEDEKDVLKLLKSLFEITGDYRTLSALDGEEAIRSVQADNPDVIILDIQLPKLDGYEVCRYVKSDPATSHIKVLLLSGMTQDYDIQKAFSLGADAYITKPFSPTALLDKVAELLGE